MSEGKNKPIVFVAGLPRSGSTLIMNLLGQNKDFYVTPTSGLVNMLVHVRNSWMHNVWFKSEGIKKVEPRIKTMLEGMIYGYHQEAFSQGKLVFDKNREWTAFIELLEEVLQQKIKIIIPVRDVRAIVASFEKIHRTSALTEHDKMQGDDYVMRQTIDGRARQLLAPGGVIGMPINRLRGVFERGLGDRLIIVPYRTLTKDPQGTMTILHQGLGVEPFAYDPDNVEQITHEDDTVHGMDLHKIRNKIEPCDKPAWLDVLPPHVCQWIENEYVDINNLAT
jgi:sulfotransferase